MPLFLIGPPQLSPMLSLNEPSFPATPSGMVGPDLYRSSNYDGDEQSLKKKQLRQ